MSLLACVRVGSDSRVAGVGLVCRTVNVQYLSNKCEIYIIHKLSIHFQIHSSLRIEHLVVSPEEHHR